MIIGSIKPNIGHGEGASGLSSVIKATLALENLTIPPNIHFQTPNPKIPFQKARLVVPIDSTPWPSDKEERVSVNSFGIGGVNAHAILESAKLHGIRSFKSGSTSEPHLLLYSSNDQRSVTDLAQRHEEYADTHPEHIKDHAYTLAHRRDQKPYRGFSVRMKETSVQVSPASKSKSIPDIALVFTGQGAQWARMGVDLLSKFPSFARDIDAMQATLMNCPHPPSWSIIG